MHCLKQASRLSPPPPLARSHHSSHRSLQDRPTCTACTKPTDSALHPVLLQFNHSGRHTLQGRPACTALTGSAKGQADLLQDLRVLKERMCGARTFHATGAALASCATQWAAADTCQSVSDVADKIHWQCRAIVASPGRRPSRVDMPKARQQRAQASLA